MESIFNLAKSLVPDLSKDRIVEDLNNTRTMFEELSDYYKLAAPIFKAHKFKSKEVIERIGKFQRIVGTKDNPAVFFNNALPYIIKNVDVIQNLLVNETNRMILASVLTLRQANLVAYVDALYLVNKGARKFLVWMEAHEAAIGRASDGSTLDEINPAEEKWLAESFLDFCNATKIVSLPPDKTMEKFDQIIDARADDKSSAALRASGRTTPADPLQLGFIGTKYNPIVFVRTIRAEWQVARYRENDEELTGLKLQLVRMENLSKNKQDPKLEEQIVYMRDRVAKLAIEVAEQERKYG